LKTVGQASIFTVLLGVEKPPPVTKMWGIMKILGVLLAVGGR
jgi:hypothetical protein